MANTIIELRRSHVSGNVPTSLANGEIAINTYDGKLFYRGGVSNTIQTIERFQGPAGLNTEIQFNDSGVLGSDSDLTYNKATDVLSAKNIVISGNSYFGNANLHEGITQLSVTNDGASAYLFDQYTGSNPSVYVGAGETLSFNLNVSGHPFVIRQSSGGANTSADLTHISTTGVVSTGADAQGKVSGVLFWKVPFSLVGSTYVYQCTIHGGMVGNIVIERPNQANSAASYANSAFAAANSASGATSAGSYANSAFLVANTPSHVANSAASYANSAFITANTPSNVANSAASYANSGFTTANSAALYANSAFSAANSASGVAAAGSYANSAFATANNSAGVNLTQNTSITSAFAAANSAGIYANSAFAFANTISGGSAIDNVARSLANTADVKATSAGIYANSAFLTANTPSHVANSAAIYANSAFAQANSGGVTIGDVLALSIALG